ncbi:MAG: type II toxin-antitoxin system PrlF family antitoxin [Chloroflexi bacterium]|nr:type II toxin-antitoxin system PrlF family antitoxin [Chloroflexota bacterium]
MRESLTVMTRKGQVTVPAEIREAMGLREGDKVAFIMEKGQVKLVKRGSVVNRTAGVLRTGKPAKSAERLREEAEKEIAGEVVERSER